MICMDKILLIIIIAPILVGAMYSLKEKKDKLKDWKPYE